MLMAVCLVTIILYNMRAMPGLSMVYLYWAYGYKYDNDLSLMFLIIIALFEWSKSTKLLLKLALSCLVFVCTLLNDEHLY